MVESYKERINSYLPERDNDTGGRTPIVEAQAAAITQKATAKELAKLKYSEKLRLAKLQPGTPAYEASKLRLQVADKIIEHSADILEQPIIKTDSVSRVEYIPAPEEVSAGAAPPVQFTPTPAPTPTPTPHVDRIVDSLMEGQGLAEGPAGDALVPTALSQMSDAAQERRLRLSRAEQSALLSLKGTTRPEVAKLIQALNINLDVQLSKSDTADLLAALLTCNESQLRALAKNKKVPIVIRTIIKRLEEDEKKGNLGTVDYLWDRIFGKGPLRPENSGAQSPQNPAQGLIPDTPVSREAYILIRDTLIK